MASQSEAATKMFRPPINRAMRALDRSFFHKEIPISAARLANNQNISRCRRELERSQDILKLDRMHLVQPDPELGHQGKRCLLLRPEIKHDDSTTWGAKVHDLVQRQELSIIPFLLKLDYNYWTYRTWEENPFIELDTDSIRTNLVEIMTSILPETDQEELPVSFTQTGHIAHVNLRDRYLPYKSLIAEVLIDKNPSATTVINKVDDVGTGSEYRTFPFEVLAGAADFNVEMKESDCTFRFDYSKVYWNSRLNTEHQRLVDLFQPGEAVCDVMAGVGPFAIPAGKKGVIVWANDLNPDSYKSLKENISINRVTPFVQAFNEDARTFIPSAIASLHETSSATPLIHLPPRHAPRPRSTQKRSTSPSRRTPMVQPPPVPLPATFSHFVMNLPASATTFLPAFIGSHAGMDHLFTPHTARKLPLIHVHCFSEKMEDHEQEAQAVLARVSGELGVVLREDEDEVMVWDVRDVAPKKRMLCVSFRLPPEVAFRFSTIGTGDKMMCM